MKKSFYLIIILALVMGLFEHHRIRLMHKYLRIFLVFRYITFRVLLPIFLFLIMIPQLAYSMAHQFLIPLPVVNRKIIIHIPRQVFQVRY